MDDLYTLGINGISIPTDSMLEHVDVKHTSNTVLLININTLVRNALSAYTTRYDPNALLTIVERVTEDIHTLKALLGQQQTKVVTYHVDYDKLPRKAMVNYTKPRTEKQIMADKTYREAVKLCRGLSEIICTGGFTKPVDLKSSSYLVMSHITHDLITANDHNIKLIESNTGNVKSSYQWNTKLNIDKTMLEYIPFNKLTYYICGDKGGDYVGLLDKAVRKQLYNIAKKYDWTSATTTNRITFCLREADAILYQQLKHLIS